MSAEIIEIISPLGQRAGKRAGVAERRGGSLQGLRVGLLDNNKPNADKFLQWIGALLTQRYGDIELVPRRKMSRTEAECLPDLIGRCDVVINAFAD
jgi:hypothetical protein